MTPKKTVKNTPRKPVEKNPKGTVKKEKSKPFNFKISIPLTTQMTEAGVDRPIINGRAPPKYKTKLDTQTKVKLANSVARQQFLKEGLPQIEIRPLTPTPRRGRKKKVISDFFHPMITINNSSECAVTMNGTTDPKQNASTQKPAPARMVTRKRLADSMAPSTAKRPKVEPETKPQTADVKIKVEDIPSTNIPALPNPELVTRVQREQEKDLEPQDTEPPSLLTPIKTKPTTRRTQTAKKPTVRQPIVRKKRLSKGKQDTPRDDSPSILTRLRKVPKKEPEEEDKTKKKLPNAPGAIDSRKPSVSSNSNLSWAKDISSSSTTTCMTVNSQDFFRNNKKRLLVKLTNIDHEIKRRQKDAHETANLDESDSSSDSSDSDCTKCNEQKLSERLNNTLEVNSLHLSTSSATNSHVLQKISKVSSPDYAKTAEQLSMSMKQIDMEIVNWMNSDCQDVNENLEKFKNKMYDILDMEFGVITHCRNLKKILDPPSVDDAQDETCASELTEDNHHQSINQSDIRHSQENQDNLVESVPVEEIAKDVNFVKPTSVRKLSTVSDGNVSNINKRVTEEETSDEEGVARNTRNYSYDHHDDDDALSLFAESITGIESSRANTYIPSAPIHKGRPVEEYVPQPVKEDIPPNTEKHTYCPTKIKTVEKQNADSTCTYKKSDSTYDTSDDSYHDLHEHIDLDSRMSPNQSPEMIKKPRLMETLYEVQPKTKSIVFGNICFYNLMNCCRKVFFGQCRFIHAIPTSAQIKAKLELLDARMLVQEYLLLRNWSELRRKYGMCYVEQCAKRGLTRILVEMAYDSIVKARNESEEDASIRVSTIEAALLHLNNVDLSVCEDLLKLTIHADQTNRTLLCDVFLATMSITQNFTRFKVVFLNLIYFMVNNDRTFNKDVVEHILERVCILPFEEPMARALIQMMRLTNSEIFNNPMIGLFEKQLSASDNKDVWEEYSMLKNQLAFKSLLASSVVETPPAPTAEADSQPPVPSPDTTDLDNKSKTAEEPSAPIITRTIGMNPPITFNRAPVSPTAKDLNNRGPSRTYNTPSPSNTDDSKPNVRKWRNRSIFPHLLPPRMSLERSNVRAPILPHMAQTRPYIRPQLRKPFNQRLVTFRSPANYVNRQPGPQY